MDNFGQSDCIVSGGSGFIGSHLLPILSEIFDKIIVLDIKPPSITRKNITYIYCDVRNISNFNINLLPIGAHLIHLAALCKEPGYEWGEYFLTNYIGTKNILDLSNKLKITNIIFTSTMMVFKAGDSRMDEDSKATPDTAYGISKLLAEEVLNGWKNLNENNRLRILRPGVVFGKGENGNYTRLYYALSKGFFFYIGRKTTIKGSIYVKDLVALIIFVLNDKEHYNLLHAVYTEQLTIEQICQNITKILNKKQFIPVIPYRIALLFSMVFLVLNSLGIRNSMHPRRIQKLYMSTDISAERLKNIGFFLKYPLIDALLDWKKDCQPNDLY